MVRVVLPVGTGGGANNGPIIITRRGGRSSSCLKACYLRSDHTTIHSAVTKPIPQRTAILVLADLLPSVPFCSIHQTLFALDVSVYSRNPDHHRHCILLFIPSSLFRLFTIFTFFTFFIFLTFLTFLTHFHQSSSFALFSSLLLSSDSHRRSFAHLRSPWIPTTVLKK